jgi:uncharacterized protein (TIGR03663 family)
MTDVAAPSKRAVPEPETARRRRSPAEWFADQDKRELAVWGVLIAVTLLVRFIGLGNRPFHHDESQDAYFSYLFRQSGDYKYNPLLHGPLRFYLTGLMYVLFGDSNFTARLAPALMGAAMVPMCWGLRPLLGRLAAFAAALLLAVGPSYLYFSRFAREDIYVASITLALLIAIWRFLDRPRTYGPALIGIFLALSFATKETTFITVFVMGSFFLFALALPPTRAQVWGPVKRAGWEGWGWALAAFAGVFTILFTTFLTNPHGLYDGVYTGLKYWLDQHKVARGGEPWEFYSVVLTTIEWPAILLGIVGAVSLWRKHMLFTAFLIWDFVLSLAVYSWAGEKFAWLVLHPLMPLILLAGAGVQGIWQARGGLRIAGFALAAVCALYVGVSSWWVNVDRGADPREMLVSTQSAPDVKKVADRVTALAASRGPGKPPLTVTVDSAQGATFPYAWYWRHLSAGYIDESLPNATPPTSDVVTLTEEAKARLQGALGAYDCNQYQFRVWWVRDYGIIHAADHTSPGPLRPGNVLKYIVSRKVWNPTGGMKEWLCVKKGL